MDLLKERQKHQNLSCETMTLATYPPAMVVGLLFTAVALFIFGLLYITNPNPPEK